MRKPSKYNLLTTLTDVNRAQVRDQLALQKIALKRVLKELTLVLQSEKPVNLIPLNPSTLQTCRQIFIINSKFSLTASRRWILTGLPVGFFTFFDLLENTWIIFIIARRRRLQTTTNWFILSLAAADLGVTCGHFPASMICNVLVNTCNNDVRIITAFFFLEASALCLTAMIGERYIAIVYSLKYVRLMTTKNTIIIIATCWAIPFLLLVYELIIYLTKASDKKSAPTPPPPAQRLELWGPRPHPLHPFYFGLKKKRIAKGRKVGRASDKIKRPHAPLPLSSTSYVDRKERALSIEGCVTPTPNPSDMWFELRCGFSG